MTRDHSIKLTSEIGFEVQWTEGRETALSQRQRNFQVLVKWITTDAELPRKRRFWLARTRPAAQLDNSVFHERFFATSVGATLLVQCDPFALPLADQGPLDLCERPHDRQQ